MQPFRFDEWDMLGWLIVLGLALAAMLRVGFALAVMS